MVDKALFSSGTDDWQTPLSLYQPLKAEFNFLWDVAANETNHLCYYWLGPESPWGADALTATWGQNNWLNPPYSMIGAFICKAVEQQQHGKTTVALIPSRTDTRYWHTYVWDQEYDCCRPGVSLRFLKGRVKFVAPQRHATNSAPFPSVVVIFRGRRK